MVRIRKRAQFYKKLVRNKMLMLLGLKRENFLFNFMK